MRVEVLGDHIAYSSVSILNAEPTQESIVLHPTPGGGFGPGSKIAGCHDFVGDKFRGRHSTRSGMACHRRLNVVLLLDTYTANYRSEPSKRIQRNFRRPCTPDPLSLMHNAVRTYRNLKLIGDLESFLPRSFGESVCEQQSWIAQIIRSTSRPVYLATGRNHPEGRG